ncbi:ORF6N domain-containing protein, partial [Fibrobacter sp.]|uniref:ORF6N domain-containing protein n=1 Tax=Fibrobacter sp. TaxID=35828 RepID=UPI0038901FDE
MKNGANEIVGGGMPVDIRSRILTIRGVQVMLDRDLAELYDVPTGALNQAVKRNAKRFPERFVFQLSEREFANWKSQIVISNSERMGLRKRPYAFTEHGITMLAALLKSERAIEISVRIVDAFVAMRRYLVSNGQILQQ